MTGASLPLARALTACVAYEPDLERLPQAANRAAPPALLPCTGLCHVGAQRKPPPRVA